jgi:spore maturation protein CgeB
MIGGLNLAQSLWCTARGYERLGFSVVHLCSDQRRAGHRKGPLEGLARTLGRMIDKHRPVLVHWWKPQHAAHAPGVEAVRRRTAGRIPWAMQSLDDPYVLEHGDSHRVANLFDVAATCCMCADEWYRKRGVRPLVAYPPCDPELHGEALPPEDPGDWCDASFVGTNVYLPSRYPEVLLDRVAMVRALHRAGIRVQLYGHWAGRNAWGNLGTGMRSLWRGWIPYARQHLVFASSRLNLCSHVLPHAHGYLNMRVVIATASGGFLLTDRVAGMDELGLVDGQNVALWSTEAELVEKALYYLDHEDERRAIAERGRAWALENHSNVRLCRIILDAVGVPAPEPEVPAA